MSRSLPGQQVEHAFKASRLNNWETPDVQKTLKTTINMNGTLKAQSGRTQFVCDDRGYLIRQDSKLNTSFNLNPQVYEKTQARWPQTTQVSSGGNPAIPMVGRATMGYKGIPTNYLPINTVMIKTDEVPHNTIPARTFNGSQLRSSGVVPCGSPLYLLTSLKNFK